MNWDCAPAPLPSLLAHATPTNIVQRPDRIIISYEHNDGRRTIWMDGRRHPPANELFYHGHSIGHYEGDVLVIETTNFTFDPDGLDDHGHPLRRACGGDVGLCAGSAAEPPSPPYADKYCTETGSNNDLV